MPQDGFLGKSGGNDSVSKPMTCGKHLVQTRIVRIIICDLLLFSTIRK